MAAQAKTTRKATAKARGKAKGSLKAAHGSVKAPKPSPPPVELVDPLESEPEAIDLPPRQLAFVKYYLETFNGTRAAELAGYNGDDNVLAVQAHHLLRKPKIQELLSQHYDVLGMPASEVLKGLREHARGTIKPFLSDEGFIDLGTDSAQQNIHLIKKVKVKKRVGGHEDDPWIETETELELHDAQAAYVHMGRHHKLFTDRVETAGTVDISITSGEMTEAERQLAEWREKQKAQLSNGSS